MSGPRCATCFYWSEVMARARHGVGLEAMCEAIAGPKSGKFTRTNDTCPRYEAAQ